MSEDQNQVPAALPCGWCHGSGEVDRMIQTPDAGPQPRPEACGHCRGTGRS